MTFDTPRAKEKIHIIYQLLLKEKKSAYDVSEQICCGRPHAYMYLKHMTDIGLLTEISSPNNVSFYISIAGATLPELEVEIEDDIEAKREARDKRKLKQKLSQIVPFKDPMLWLLFGKS